MNPGAINSDINSAMTMRSLYAPIRENPHEKKAKMLSAMMPESGLASPLVALATGRELSNAENWDVQREEEGKAAQQSAMGMYKQNLDQDNATKIFTRVTELAKLDPKAATMILQKEAAVNPALAPFKDVEINNMTKDGWMAVKPGDGKAYMVYAPNLGAAVAAGKDSELWNKTVIPFEGEGKEGKAREEFDTKWTTHINKYYLDNNIDPVKATKEQVNAASLYADNMLEMQKNRIAQNNRAPKADRPEPDHTGALGIMEGDLAANWYAKVQDPSKIKTDNYTGKANYASVLEALPPAYRDQMRRQRIDAEAMVKKGVGPADAVNRAIQKWSGAQPAAGGAGTPAKGKTPLSRENIVRAIEKEIVRSPK